MSDSQDKSSAEIKFVRVCDVKEIGSGKGKSFRVGKLFLAIFQSDGKFYATSDVCSHEHELLSEGWLEGTTVECPRHGAVFDLVTGEAKSLPASKPIDVFALKIEGADVMVGVPVKYLNEIVG